MDGLGTRGCTVSNLEIHAAMYHDDQDSQISSAVQSLDVVAAGSRDAAALLENELARITTKQNSLSSSDEYIP
jgi:hypothetical protein